MLLASRLNFSNSQITRARGVSGLYKAAEKEAHRRYYGVADAPKSGNVALGSPGGPSIMATNINDVAGLINQAQQAQQAQYPYYPSAVGTGAGGVVYTQQYPGGPLVYGPQPVYISITEHQPHAPSLFPSPAFSDDEIERAEKIMEECDAARAS